MAAVPPSPTTTYREPCPPTAVSSIRLPWIQLVATGPNAILPPAESRQAAEARSFFDALCRPSAFLHVGVEFGRETCQTSSSAEFSQRKERCYEVTLEEVVGGLLVGVLFASGWAGAQQTFSQPDVSPEQQQRLDLMKSKGTEPH